MLLGDKKEISKEKIKEIDEKAKTLLNYIYNYKMKPSWWKWWIFSPHVLHRYTKRIIFVLLVLFIGYFLLSPLWTVNIDLSFLRYVGKLKRDGNWQLYFIIDVFLFFLLLSPTIYRFKASDIEVEFSPPEMPQFVLKTLEPSIREIDLRMQSSSKWRL